MVGCVKKSASWCQLYISLVACQTRLLWFPGKPGAKAQAAAKSKRKKQTRKRKLEQTGLAAAVKAAPTQNRVAEPASLDRPAPAALVPLVTRPFLHSGVACHPGPVLAALSQVSADSHPAIAVPALQPATAMAVAPQLEAAIRQSSTASTAVPLSAPTPPQLDLPQEPLPSVAAQQATPSMPSAASHTSQLPSHQAAEPQQLVSVVLPSVSKADEVVAFEAPLEVAAQQTASVPVTQPLTTAAPEWAADALPSPSGMLQPASASKLSAGTDAEPPQSAAAQLSAPSLAPASRVASTAASTAAPTQTLAMASPSLPGIVGNDQDVMTVGDERAQIEARSSLGKAPCMAVLGSTDDTDKAPASYAEQVQPECPEAQPLTVVSERPSTDAVAPTEMQEAAANDFEQQTQSALHPSGMAQAVSASATPSAAARADASAQHTSYSLLGGSQPPADHSQAGMAATQIVRHERSSPVGSQAAADDAVMVQSLRTGKQATGMPVYPSIVGAEPNKQSSTAASAAGREGAGGDSDTIMSSNTHTALEASILLPGLAEQKVCEGNVDMKLKQDATQAREFVSDVTEGTVTILADHGLLSLGDYGDTDLDSDS